MAPEIHEQKPYDGHKRDIFELAVSLFIMVSGTPPFGNAIINDRYYKPLYQKNYDLFWKYHKYKKKDDFFSSDFMDLISKLLA